MSSSAYVRPPVPVNEPVSSFISGSPERELLQQTLNKYTKQDPVEIPLVIGGRLQQSESTVDVFSPQNKSLVIARCAQATKEDVHESIKVAVEAQKSWSTMPLSERSAVFLKAADLLATKYRYDIAATTMLGQGKSCHQAEIDAVCELVDFLRFNVHFAHKINEIQPMISPRGLWNHSQMRGLQGFVFAVAPFNFTAISVNLATAPAIMGCSVLWKPSPTAVLSSYLAYQILEEAGLPPGVINFVPGDPSLVGDIALSNENLAGVHFTGSTKTFEHIWGKVGNNISNYKSYPRVVGETGGKDFVFAHKSADPQELITGLIRGSFEYQGQKCSAASRAYIPKSLWEKIKTSLVEKVNNIKMGDPGDFSNFVNAVIDERSFKKIVSFIDYASSSSEATILCGGEYDDSKGYFIRPTIIEANSPTYKSMVEEIFGPVLTVYVYEDSSEEETLRLCDETTPYALTGAIYAKDRGTIERLTNSLVNSAGNFYINDKPTGAVVGQQPFGGGRKSGTNDKAGCELNLLRWTSMRSIKESLVPITDYRYPFMD